VKIIFIILFSFVTMAVLSQASVSDFKSFDIVSNDSIALNDFSRAAGVAIIFTSATCAFDNYYTERIKLLINEYQGKIQFLLVNSSLGESESIETMKEWSVKRRVNAPYLVDKNQLISAQFEAKKTPEVFLLKSVQGSFTIFYAGSLDDNPQVAADVKQRYLKDNIERLLSGKPNTENVRAVGCTIRKN
jgi:hypothetical protein